MASTATIESGQSLLDVSVQHCGSVEVLLSMAAANGVSITDNVASGKELAIVDIVEKSIVNIFSVLPTKPATAITAAFFCDTVFWSGLGVKATFSDLEAKQSKVLSGQSLLDIAVEKCGSIEAAFNLAILNGIGINEIPTAGQTLQLPDVVNKAVVNSFSVSQTKPATGITTSENNETISQEGIEFWAIETDFVVS